MLWSLGRLLVRIDPLQPADAIYVLGGSRASRALEAAELYRAGLASRIVMSPGATDTAEQALRQRGIRLPTDADIMRSVLIDHLGVPATAVLILPDDVDNTAQEATVIARMAKAEGWHRLIVLTMCAATRRAGIAFNRALDRGVALIVRCPRYDTYDGRGWWTRRESIRETLVEAPKLLAYWLGLRD